MTTASKAKTAKVIVTAPKISTAWTALVNTTAKNDSENVTAISRLVSAMNDSQLSIRDIQSVIKDSGKVSTLVKVSHVEGLQTWSNLRKHAEFIALPLASQLSKAVASYKMLGAGNAEQLGSWDAVAKATKEATAVKTAKKSAPKADKAPKAKATNAGTLKEINAYFMALDLATLSDAELDLIAEIHATIEGKVEVMA